MFTGIVQERGRVSSFEDGRLVVESGIRAGVGDSVAVDGVCLTVTRNDDGKPEFDVMVETERRAKPFGAEVNLESALRAGEPLGGHYVQGHVDAVGTVRSVEDEGDGRRVWFDVPADVLRYLVEKGSVTVDGVSLTVAELDESGFAVALVQHTLEVTTLGRLAPDATVNLETDVLAKYVERLLRSDDIRQGKLVVVVDAADRENEGDLTIAAQFATPEAINFMTKEARGLICLCLTEERCDELGLRQMTEKNETPYGTAFTVSVEAREGVTTGISAPDRSRTIQVAIDPKATAEDLVQPGHVFPLRAREGGVLMRAGQTEAAVDLARLAGLIPAGGLDLGLKLLNADLFVGDGADQVADANVDWEKRVSVWQLGLSAARNQSGRA